MAREPRYLVTGGAGFIGSNLVETIIGMGEPVRILDNFATGRRSNLASMEGRFELVEGDIRDPKACREAVRGVEVIYHLAALPSVPRSVEDPLTSHQVNVEGTLNVLVAAQQSGVRRVVAASSSAIYGMREGLPRYETDPPDPLSPYAAAKLAGEYYAWVYTKLHGLETVCLRYFNVFGPRQDPASQYAAVVPSFITSVLRGESPVIYGDGNQSRDFTFVQNVVQANLRAGEAPGAGGSVLNIACGTRFSINGLLDEIKGILGSDVKARYLPPRAGDVPHSQADIGLARSVIGYNPAVDFSDGLRRTVDWFRQTTAN